MIFVQKNTMVGTGRTPREEKTLKLECEGLVGPVATSLASLEKWFFALLKNVLFFIICFLGGRSQLFSLNWEIFAKFHQLRIWLIFYQYLCWEKTPLCYSVRWEVLLKPALSGTMSNSQNVRFICACDGIIWLPAVQMRGLISIM